MIATKASKGKKKFGSYEIFAMLYHNNNNDLAVIPSCIVFVQYQGRCIQV